MKSIPLDDRNRLSEGIIFCITYLKRRTGGAKVA